MQEEKAACSFEQTPGGWSPKGKELGSQVWPWISLAAHRPEEPPTQWGSASTHQACLPSASLSGQVEAEEERTHRGLSRSGSDLDAFGTSSPAILLLFNSDMMVCFIRKKKKNKKRHEEFKPYGKPPWMALIIWSFTQPERHFSFLKDQMIENFLLDPNS